MRSQTEHGINAEQAAIELHQFLRERANATPATILVLGTFHFEGSSTDARSTGDMNMMSPRRQVEIDAVLDLLETFEPTKVAVEVRSGAQEQLTERYRQYVDGETELEASEVYQLGFRLAKRRGLDTVHAIDAPGRWLEPRADLNATAREQDQQGLLNDPYDIPIFMAEQREDEVLRTFSLRDSLLFLNSPAHLRAAHAIYLLQKLAVGDDDNYPGADGFVSQWYNRNLRIYANVLRIVELEGERIVLIIGSGHVPILHHLFDASLHFDVVEVRDVLGDGDPTG